MNIKTPQAPRLSGSMLYRYFDLSPRWNMVQRASKMQKWGYRQSKDDPIKGNPLESWGLKNIPLLWALLKLSTFRLEWWQSTIYDWSRGSGHAIWLSVCNVHGRLVGCMVFRHFGPSPRRSMVPRATKKTKIRVSTVAHHLGGTCCNGRLKMQNGAITV